MNAAKEVSFDVSHDAAKVIGNIARRAAALSGRRGRSFKYPAIEVSMDVTACHANGMPLRLSDLLAADDFNFTHDVFGIRRHLNRETGKLENFFRPRFAA